MKITLNSAHEVSPLTHALIIGHAKTTVPGLQEIIVHREPGGTKVSNFQFKFTTDETAKKVSGIATWPELAGVHKELYLLKNIVYILPPEEVDFRPSLKKILNWLETKDEILSFPEKESQNVPITE